jgi:hypothetical protein
VSSARAFSCQPGCPAFGFLGSFPKDFLLRMDADCAVDNIESLIPFPRQQSNRIEQIIRAWPEP